MTAISTLTNKNQTTVPKVVVEALDIKPSDKLIYEIEGDHVVLRAQTGRLADLLNESPAGPQPKRSLSQQQIDRAIGRHLAGEETRIRQVRKHSRARSRR